MTLALDTPLGDVVGFDDYRRASELISSLLDHIGPDDWTNRTPNTEWDVEALVRHVTEEHVWAEQLIAGTSLDRAQDLVAGRMQVNDLIGLFRTALDDVTAMAAQVGASERVETSSGLIPATSYLQELTADQLIHAWDLAKGLGRELVMPADLVEKVSAWFASNVEKWRAAGLIGPAVAIDRHASPQTRLLAQFGRDAGWM